MLITRADINGNLGQGYLMAIAVDPLASRLMLIGIYTNLVFANGSSLAVRNEAIYNINSNTWAGASLGTAQPSAVAYGPGGTFYMADSTNDRVWRLDPYNQTTWTQIGVFAKCTPTCSGAFVGTMIGDSAQLYVGGTFNNVQGANWASPDSGYGLSRKSPDLRELLDEVAAQV